jgi:universal stress protein A
VFADAKNAHDSARAAERGFIRGLKLEPMKTAVQRIETTDIMELVQQVLHLRKILVPTDFSETSKKAVQYALRFAEQFGCEIALLYVVEPATPMIGAPLAVEPFTDKGEFSMAEKDLAALAAESHTNGAHSVSSFVRIGHAPNEITKAAKDLDVDLIIISTHGYTSWRHLCIGSTAERVVRTAPCPVLVVREKEHEFV